MRSIKISIIIIFVCCKVSLQLYAANQINSILKQYAQAPNDTNKINLLNTLCKEYRSIGKNDTALYYGNAALLLAKQLNIQKRIGDGYNTIGLIYYSQGNYDKALENHFASLKIRRETGDKNGISNSYNNIGVVYHDQGSYEKSLDNHLKSLKIREAIGDKIRIADSYNNIGIIYQHQGNYEKALDNHLKSLKINEEMGYNLGIASSYNNIGIVYGNLGNYEKALDNHLKSLKINEEMGYNLEAASAYNNIGNMYEILGNYEKTLDNHLKALKIRQKMGDKKGIAASYTNVGIIYMKQTKFDESYNYLKQGLIIFKEMKNKDGIKEAYSGLSDLYSKKGGFKQAYKYHKLYSDIKDSLLNEQSSKHIAEMETKYETEKKEKEIKLLNNENKIKALEIAEQQNQLLNHKILFVSLIVGIILISVISWLLISRNRIRQKEILKTEHIKQQQLRTKAIIEMQEQERKRIAQDLHDGIGQTLAAMKMNISSKTKFVSEENQKILQQIVVSIDSAHREVRTLSHSMMPKALNESGLEDAIDDLLEKILANSTIKCIFEKDSAIRFDENTEIGLYRVFQELINNILKHANSSEISVHLHKTKTQIILMVEDNGVGIKQKQLGEKKGMGLSNIETRVHALNGTFSISAGTHQGTIAVVRIPANNNQSITIV